MQAVGLWETGSGSVLPHWEAGWPALIEAEGPRGLSMRALARRAGVSIGSGIGGLEFIERQYTGGAHGVESVRQGKVIEIDLEETDRTAAEATVTRMCEMLEVSQSAYYDWLKRPESAHRREDREFAFSGPS